MNNYENHPSYIQKRIQIQKEINQDRVNINRSVFAKNDEAKALAKKAKLKWRAKMRLTFPGFKAKLWGSNKYRLEHPQSFK